MTPKWLVTGVSGSGRIEMLKDLEDYAKTQDKKIKVIDVGKAIEAQAKENRIPFDSDRILNMDQATLTLLRALAVKAVIQEIENDEAQPPDKKSDIIFIGMHALFFWEGKLIPGVSYHDLLAIDLDGIITVVDDVKTVCETNAKNPKWAQNPPSPESFQRWMMEEELLSDVFASIKGVPMYVFAKNQGIENFFDFFFSKKKKIYLSYPITAVRKEHPELLERILNEYKPRLEKMFFVFNPLDIMDKTHVSQSFSDIPGFMDPDSVALIDARTIERDYRFIAQSDAVVVIYLTDKQSPGVYAEMHYAYYHQIPVYMLFTESISPFLDKIANIYNNEDDFFIALEDFNKN